MSDCKSLLQRVMSIKADFLACAARRPMIRTIGLKTKSVQIEAIQTVHSSSDIWIGSDYYGPVRTISPDFFYNLSFLSPSGLISHTLRTLTKHGINSF